MSKTARRQDAIKYNESSLKCLPGQILPAERCSESVKYIIYWIYSPSSETKCHRVPVHHIYIELSILQIPFRSVFHGIIKNFWVMQYGPKRRQSTQIRPSNRSNWPCTAEHDRPFRNIVTTILIIVSSHVGKGFMIRQDSTDDDDDKDEQRGATK